MLRFRSNLSAFFDFFRHRVKIKQALYMGDKERNTRFQVLEDTLIARDPDVPENEQRDISIGSRVGGVVKPQSKKEKDRAEGW